MCEFVVAQCALLGELCSVLWNRQMASFDMHATIWQAGPDISLIVCIATHIETPWYSSQLSRLTKQLGLNQIIQVDNCGLSAATPSLDCTVISLARKHTGIFRVLK